MNKIIVVPLSVLLLFSAQSCKTVQTVIDTDAAEEHTHTEDLVPIESIDKTPVPEPVQSTAPSFAELNEGVVLSIKSSPAATTKNAAFSKPYVIDVTKDSVPLSDYAIKVFYPASKDAESVSYSSDVIKTDSSGVASFFPPVPKYSFDSSVIFQPDTDSSDPAVIKLVSGMAVKAAWKVSTDYKRKGGIICVTGTNMGGSTIFSSRLLMSLLNNGFVNVGNADFTDEIKSGNQQAVYKAARQLAGNSSAYLIYGTVGYVNDILKTDKGYKCTLTSRVYCLDMKSGKELFTTSRTCSAEKQNKQNAIEEAMNSLAAELTEAIIYGM